MLRFLYKVVKRMFKKQRFLKKRCVQTVQVDYSPSRYIKSELAEIQPRFEFQPGSFAEWRESARVELKRLLGEFPAGPDCVIDELKIWEAEDQEAVYEKVILRVGDSRHLPLYRGVSKRGESTRTLVCLQGHTSGMHLSLGMDNSESFVECTTPNRALASYAIRQGFNVVCLEQESLGERVEKSLKKKAPHPCFDSSMHHLLLGKTLLGTRVAEALTVVSYEKSRRSKVKMGLMGNSLGGTVALFASAISDEPDFAVASCCISDFRDSLFNIYHCADLYIPDLASSFRMGDILGLCAPKPLILCAGLTDPIFPMMGFAKAWGEAERIYDSARARESLSAVIGPGGHRLFLAETFSETSRVLAKL